MDQVSTYGVVDYCVSENVTPFYLECNVMFQDIFESVSNIHQPINE